MMDEPRRRLVGIVSGLDVRYDHGEGNPCSDAASELDIITGRRARAVRTAHGQASGLASMSRRR